MDTMGKIGDIALGSGGVGIGTPEVTDAAGLDKVAYLLEAAVAHAGLVERAVLGAEEQRR
ncbi:hypothetical protein E2562_013161 [Oryza meyeriana var. granulata]|uniref:Uncharacterized protein n=1 Tax=Oryza meyeriana var. granulata TaxID=110450 RepID=A0A6G1DIF5_9ORYZ|nr:hypothetical protein E2562_013161 [Oryza meyeriana var. granulata]